VRVSVSTALLGPAMLSTTRPAAEGGVGRARQPRDPEPETGAVLEAFRALDFRVVVDQFLTDTAREADLVLPAKTMFEQTDVINAYWHPYIQIKTSSIEPPGEVKPESEIYWELAHRLGFPAGRDRCPAARALRRGGRGVARGEAPAVPRAHSGRLREGPVLAPGAEEVAWSDLRFPTPSGRIELLSEEAAVRWGADPLPV
jgi:anaerobic selenocysteine-containing dehydrogenase